jgi:hypothetical protein
LPSYSWISKFFHYPIKPASLSTGFHHITEAGLELELFLLQPSPCLDYSCAPMRPSYSFSFFLVGLGVELRTSPLQSRWLYHLSQSILLWLFFGDGGASWIISQADLKLRSSQSQPPKLLGL